MTIDHFEENEKKEIIKQIRLIHQKRQYKVSELASILSINKTRALDLITLYSERFTLEQLKGYLKLLD